MRKWMRIFGLFFVVIIFENISNVSAATLSWNAVTTYTDGSTIPATLPKTYTMKSGMSVTGPFSSEGVTTSLSGTVSEPSPGTTKWYTVSCIVDGKESDNYYPAVSITAPAKVPGPPTNLWIQ